MEKTIFSKEYSILLRELRKVRKLSGLSQEELAKRLGESQSFVSKCERGERRLDVVELRSFCNAIGISFLDFMTQVGRLLDEEQEPK